MVSLKERLDVLSMEVDFLTKELVAWQSLKEKSYNKMLKSQKAEDIEEYLNLVQKLDECRNKLAGSQKRYQDFMVQYDKENIISKYPAEMIRLAYTNEIPEELSELASMVQADVKEVVGFKPSTESKAVQTEPGV